MRNGSETVGLYLDGRPHSDWWHRQGDVQTLYYSSSPNDHSFLLFHGPASEMGSDGGAVSYEADESGDGGSVRNVVSVQWDKRKDGGGEVWQATKVNTDNEQEPKKVMNDE